MAVNEHYDRLRVVIETLAYAQPDMRLEDALPAIFAIEDRAIARPAPGALSVPDQPVSSSPGDVARWIDAHGHKYMDVHGDSITDLIRLGKKINAIKETRAATSLGLKEAKEGVEEYERMYV